MAGNRKAWISWSGGKDSLMALLAATARGICIEGALITINRHGYIPMHNIPRKLIALQLHSLGIKKHIWHCIPAHASNSTYESSLARILSRIREMEKAEIIVFGDIFLEDVRHYREKLLSHFHLQALFPLWGEDTRRLSENFIQSKHNAIVCTVDCRYLPAHFAGSPYNTRFLKSIQKYKCDPCGENGEFHTFVYAGPAFPTPVTFRATHRITVKNHHFSPPLTLASVLLTCA